MQTFELFRFQLLPISQHQQELFSIPFTAEEIRARKNEFFDETLTKLPPFRHRGLEIKHKIEYHKGDWFILKVGAHKSVDRDTEEFHRERIESWPNVTIVIHNNPETQVISISRNQRAFSSTSSVAKLLARTVEPILRTYGLTIQIREQFEENNFWSVLSQYEGRVSRVRFEMVSPNMANISRVLKVDLRQLNRDSNCQKTDIQLEAVPGAALEIKRKDDLIEGCVKYASMGGGDIAIKVRGLKKEIRTSTTVKSVEIDELFLQAPGADLLGIVNRLLAK